MEKATKISLIACLSLFFVQTIYANVITTPEGLSAGDQYRLVFVTMGMHDASSTEIDVYNSFVTTEANGSVDLASLSTGWRVLGSTPDVDAVDNTNTGAGIAGIPIYDLNGVMVANDYADLWDGTLDNPIGVDQYGNNLSSAVFTGTGIDGLGPVDRELGANGYRVMHGYSSSITSGWTAADWSGSLNSLHYYAISEVLVVPEPLTVLLMSIGGYVVRSRQRR